jgi:hypothetical protein
MEQKTFPAFGHYVVKNEIEQGEVINDDFIKKGVFTADADFKQIWLQISGRVRHVEVNTGESYVRLPGHCSLTTPEPVGKWRIEPLEPYTVFCIPYAGVNVTEPALIDTLQLFTLSDGESTTIPVGTKLSLCSGSLQVGDVTLPPLRQIGFSSGDKVVTAIGKCWGFIFP